ncbi:hypothetical protein JD541_08255 [Aeromonas dhakensis]|uniref:hypothetical protein n=1 Tax=Aeromonas dhakensis TaxID=196024 RepID=UPI0011165E6B|nr:hypothetical protein [Aeromonas dhakensis]MBL0532966.1 hypothetical protein [Aeromonas dhakensis]
MNTYLTKRIANHETRLVDLLNATSVKYSAWPETDKSVLSKSAGVYLFFEKLDDHIVSIYIGKGGYGGGKDWSIYKRLNQHFQVSQNYALIGKASKATGLSSSKMKDLFESGNFYLQWILFATKPEPVPPELESSLRLFECFAISVLNPRYTDS